MSRSFKKNTFCGNAKADSEKQDKRLAHKALRAHMREALSTAKDIEDVDFCEKNEAHSNVWSWAKDGRHRFSLHIKHTPKGLKVLTKDVNNPITSRDAHKAIAK